MKKTLLLVICTLLCLVTKVQAQELRSNCYRGNVEAGYSVGIGDYNFGRFEINTTHGYQFNPNFFLGAGTGLHFMSSYETGGMDIALDARESKVDIPVFANIRCNLLNKKFSPFVDVKGGTFVTNNGGLYLVAAVGCRYAINDKYALSLSAGYAKEKLEFETFDDFVGSQSMDYKTSPRKLAVEAISIKLGFEF